MGKPRVLCVDDEPRVLDGLRLVLGRRFDLSLATSGEEGLRLLGEGDVPFAAVVSDMRMPRMDGAAFLAKVREASPDTVRLLLTGGTDLESAVKAVNEGQIFRFLTKPTDRDDLTRALESAVEQYRLITAERVLLEETLHGSIQALTDVLSLTSPMAFGRAGRIKRRAADLAERLGVPDGWQIEVAAMLSQIGYVTLPSETAEKVFRGKTLSPDEQKAVSRVPDVTAKILENIPRLEPVLDILKKVNKPLGEDPNRAPPLGSRILRVAADYDMLEAEGHSGDVAIESMRRERAKYDPKVLTALAEVTQTEGMGKGIQSCPISDLRPGMVMAEDVFLESGVLFIAKGYEVTESFVELARSLDPAVIGEKVRVLTD